MNPEISLALGLPIVFGSYRLRA